MPDNTLLDFEPYTAGLRLYCLSLARNEWDAEDLMQEVLARVYLAIRQSPARQLSQAYLYRTARNVWIDQYRKMSRRPVIASQAIEDSHLSSGEDQGELRLREHFEQLAHLLNPRQLVLILMLDVFMFTAQETAVHLHSTTGAVKEGVKRARQRLRSLAAASRDGLPPEQGSYDSGKLSPQVFEQFLEGFRTGNPRLICRAYLTLVRHGVRVEKAGRSEELHFNFRDPNGHLIGFFQKMG
ncbi:RNA polymerase sigma factor [Paenibacillus sp. J22TS3]|uniref:RNA polymerase sigma factor n=1 Tax=Paenibacillus sp. J22TS3 TaxID=2807192 RepID=UPI001B0BC41B|nr:RNA polymerase sigma factor [Paenibacillus sp. J22TS3]GIP22069.1 hypothetical protein J22TS3_23440 [Paenibacillus sp. J22TS3]